MILGAMGNSLSCRAQERGGAERLLRSDRAARPVECPQGAQRGRETPAG